MARVEGAVWLCNWAPEPHNVAKISHLRKKPFGRWSDNAEQEVREAFGSHVTFRY